MKFFFSYPEQATKAVFHCRTKNAEFTGNSKVVDREIRDLLRDLRSTFINITGARYQRSHQGE